jgi:hypothetical protein
MILGFFLFFLAGLGFGYALEGRGKWLPLIFPLLLGIGALVQWGLDGAIFVKLLIALLVTVAGIVLGTLLAQRGGQTADAA